MGASLACAASKMGANRGRVEVLALGVGVDDDAREVELLYGALDLGGSLFGVLGRDGGQAGEPVGVFADGLGEAVVGELGERDGLRAVEHLEVGDGRDAEDGEVDPCGVHGGQAPRPRSRVSAPRRSRSASSSAAPASRQPLSAAAGLAR